MEKVKNIFRKINEKLVYQILICVGVMVVLLVVYTAAMDRIDRMRVVRGGNHFLWVYQIDFVEQKDKELVMNGWAFELGVDSENNRYEILLWDIDTQEKSFLDMRYSVRKDVNEYFLCEYDYSQSGFTATISMKELDMENAIYEIMLRPKDEYYAIPTGMYLENGKIYYTNPEKFVKPDVYGTQLEKIVENGVLRAYQPDYGTYVYQYDGYIYWIVEGIQNFIEGDWLVQYQMNTTQRDNLPEERLNNEWYWSNISFWFQDNEYIGNDIGKYRVSKCALPTDYSVTRMWTGNYIKDWLWKCDFYPWYDFE